MWLQHGVTVTLVRRTLLPTPDSRGNDQFSEQQIDVPYSAVDSGPSTEVTIGTEEISTDVVWYAPFGTVVTALDAFLFNGIKYEVQGTPVSHQSPFTGSQGTVEIRGKVVQGAAV